MALEWHESALEMRESALAWCESALEWRESACPVALLQISELLLPELDNLPQRG